MDSNNETYQETLKKTKDLVSTWTRLFGENVVRFRLNELKDSIKDELDNILQETLEKEKELLEKSNKTEENNESLDQISEGFQKDLLVEKFEKEGHSTSSKCILVEATLQNRGRRLLRSHRPESIENHQMEVGFEEKLSEEMAKLKIDMIENQKHDASNVNSQNSKEVPKLFCGDNDRVSSHEHSKDNLEIPLSKDLIKEEFNFLKGVYDATKDLSHSQQRPTSFFQNSKSSLMQNTSNESIASSSCKEEFSLLREPVEPSDYPSTIETSLNGQASYPILNEEKASYANTSIYFKQHTNDLFVSPYYGICEYSPNPANAQDPLHTRSSMPLKDICQNRLSGAEASPQNKYFLAANITASTPICQKDLSSSIQGNEVSYPDYSYNKISEKNLSVSVKSNGVISPYFVSSENKQHDKPLVKAKQLQDCCCRFHSNAELNRSPVYGVPKKFK